jgi:SagB-type dehydrogenase family enzyme
MKASEYHLLTSYDRRKMSGRSMDWANQPEPYKRYPGLETIPLHGNLKPPEVMLSSLLDPGERKAEVSTISFEGLSLLLLLTLTFTAKSHDFLFRSAASAGALYPTELYVATREIKGLDDALYHFNIRDHGLTPLPGRDATRDLRAATRMKGNEGPLLSFVVTAVYFRSAWKYGDRSYRYDLLDSGHVLENLVLALRALQLRFSCSYDFDDDAVNRLLGLEEKSEAALALVHVGGSGRVPWPEGLGEPYPPTEGSDRESKKDGPGFFSTSNRTVSDYPLVREIHGSGIGPSTQDRGFPEIRAGIPLSPRESHEIRGPFDWPEIMNYPKALYRRRSRRNFIRKPVGREGIMALLRAVSSSDPEEKRCLQPVSEGFLLGAEEHLDPGFYLFDPERTSVRKAKSGLLMAEAAEACLNQMWLSNSAFLLILAADLDLIDRSWAARGYRYAMLSAGRIGQRLYLAATALGLGCCGIGAFYDRELADILGLGESFGVLYLVSIGRVKGLPE